MSDTTYNGWTNYETWAVGMYLDGNYTGSGTYEHVCELVRSQLSFQHLEADGRERARVAEYLQAFVTDATDPCGYGNDDAAELNPLVSDLLGAALASVNWYELADAWIENMRENESYVIVCYDAGAYWSNDDGWGARSTATVFTRQERDTLTLPMDASGWEQS